MRASLLAVLILAAAAGAARADSSYAIVVGSNQGGSGQTDLRYAEQDAARVSSLLTELGGYDAANVTTLSHPDPDQVLTAIERVADKVRADAAAGGITTVFFYYSGHAKASALDLGDHELALDTLREKLIGLPSALTVVVLDACQSGAFSRIKGAEGAADFSFNSKSRLDATGVAVLASSTGSELSQESDVLESSYFTHHLLVGLRGAADASKDGQVTIDEAYQYAYNQTLIATAKTAVGSQHVSLEVDLKGHGEVPLSYPQKATAQLELPAAVAGEVLIEKTKASAVLAELHKAAGDAVRVAVAPGAYSVLIRKDKVVQTCPVEVRSGGTAIVDLDGCSESPLVDTAVKGGVGGVAAWPGVLGDGRRWTMAVTGGVGDEMGDALTDRLQDFGYHKQFLGLTSRVAVTGLYRLGPSLQLGGMVGVVSSPEWQRDTVGGGQPLRYSWTTFGFIGVARADHTFGFAPRLRLYVQGGGGLGIGQDKLHDEADRTFSEVHFGPVLTASSGIDWTTPWWRSIGVGISYTFMFAPVITNRTDDRHMGVGQFLDLSAHYRF